METKDDDIEEILVRQKYFFGAKINKIENLQSKIKAIKGNYLFTDIVGRVLWHAVSTSKTIEHLIQNDDAYGIHSIARKLIECSLLLDYLFNATDRNNIISNILAQHYFDKQEESDRDLKEWMIQQVEKLVNEFEENPIIIEYFKDKINSKSKHWSWTNSSFNKLLKNSILDEMPDYLKDWSFDNRKSVLNLLHKGSHINLDLETGFFKEENGDIVFRPPSDSSKEQLHGTIGISGMLIDEIHDIIESNMDTLNNSVK